MLPLHREKVRAWREVTGEALIAFPSRICAQLMGPGSSCYARSGSGNMTFIFTTSTNSQSRCMIRAHRGRSLCFILFSNRNEMDPTLAPSAVTDRGRSSLPELLGQ